MIFNEGIIGLDTYLDDLPSYTIDTLLEEIGKPVEYDLDVALTQQRVVPYNLSTRLIRVSSAVYEIATYLTIDKNDPRFQESIINAALWSYSMAA